MTVRVQYGVSGEKSFWMDRYLHTNLTLLKNYVQQANGDAVIIVSGVVGVGKSFLAGQICAFFDPLFNEKHLVFNHAQLQSAIETLPFKSAIQVDEAHSMFSSRNITDRRNREALALLLECRYKGFCLVLCTPEYARLNSELAITRSACMIQVFQTFKDNGLPTRGYYAFYNRQKKAKAWWTAKKIGGIVPSNLRNFWGKFAHHCVVDEAEYQKRKLEGLRELHAKKTEAIPK